MAPATNKETAARRRMRRTRMRSAATSGAGGHEAPLGQLAASSAWTSAALERPLTTASVVTSRSPMVASGRSASASSRRTWSSAPVSISRVDSWRWCRNVGREPEAAPVLVHDLGGGARAGEEADVEVGQLGHERPADDDARSPRLDRGPGDVERVLPVQLELVVRDRPGARRAAGPRRGQALAPEARARCRVT